MRRLLTSLFGVYAWALLIVCVLVTTAMLLVVPGLRRRRQIARRNARILFWLTGVKLNVRGAPLDTVGTSVVVSNHASYLDGIILTAVLPPDFSFVVKREMNSFPVAGLLLRRLGTEFVERYDFRRGARDARRIIRTATTGQGLAAFPEGTFRREPGLGQFYSGAFSAALRGGMTVVPVSIRGSRDILPAEQSLPVPGDLDIVVHPAIPAATEVSRAEMMRLRDTARQYILAGLDEPDLDFKLSGKTAGAAVAAESASRSE